MSIVRHRITPTASPTELANQINRALAAIAKQFDAISAPSATTVVPAAASPFDTVAAPPGTGGGTGIPPAGAIQLAGDVTGDIASNIVGGIQTIPILKPTVDGTVATFVLGVPDIEWKTPGAASAQFRLITLAFAASPYSATLVSTQITFYMASSGAGADFIFNLPAATGSGNVAIIKKMDANAHNIAVTPNGADTVDGVNSAANSTVTIQYDVVELVDSASGAWSTW